MWFSLDMLKRIFLKFIVFSNFEGAPVIVVDLKLSEMEIVVNLNTMMILQNYIFKFESFT